jgi:hypothetical protein
MSGSPWILQTGKTSVFDNGVAVAYAAGFHFKKYFVFFWFGDLLLN